MNDGRGRRAARVRALALAARGLVTAVALVAPPLVALAPASVHAQPNASKRALELGYEADGLFARGKWDEAFDRFEKADALAHSPVFVLYMARCRRNAGRLLEAATLYARVAAERVAPDAPKPFRAAVTDATTELAELEARTPTVRVEVRGRAAEGVDVRVDGRPIQVGKKVALDPGTHAFVASASGAPAIERSVTLAEGSKETLVELDFTKAGGANGTSGANGAGTGPATATPNRGSVAPAVVALSFGVVGVGLGAVTGAMAAGGASDVKDGCVDDHCLRSDADALDRARTLATVSTIGFVAGGVCLAAAGVLFVLRPGGGSQASASARVGPGFVAVGGAF